MTSSVSHATTGPVPITPLLFIRHIGNAHASPAGWPEKTIDGLIDAMERWELDRRWDTSGDQAFEPHVLCAPFRAPALGCKGRVFVPSLGCYRYLDGDPIHADHPTAVSYLGNFVGYSFPFSFHTDDQDLIARLDAAIARNIQRYACGFAG